ncbi:TonB-dependent receptor [Candidatus Korobacter versatilis]|uniref:TonB-dependent receptor n=1 Tax=Candidatus Korobacter versatilis TaxID=658062 RepID=UPI00031FEFB2|nr:TonB-dependent receptor [Candidatus Koribacter versatilis]
MRVRLLFFFFLILSLASAMAQTTTGSLRGRVTDPSGAVVQNATVTASTADGKQSSAKTNAQGAYEVHGLAPGSYTVTITAKGFADDTESAVNVTAGLPQQLDVAMQIEVEKQQVQVQEDTNAVDTSSTNNASALVLKGKDLEALSDDPDELQSELEALAGPAAGPNGGQMYIDGFTGGQLPPKASIREIRINQNPFSAEYDKLGYGRIEIFTKPGLDKFHGQVMVMGNDDAFNATNPYATQNGTPIPPYHSEQYSFNIGGPVISKKASFSFNFERRNITDQSIVFAQTLDPTTYDPLNVNAAVNTPRTRTNISPRFDYQVSQNNTLTLRYQYWLEEDTNSGIGGYSLPTVAYNLRSPEHTFQISDTQVLNSHVINETRFQYVRDLTEQTPLNTIPLINVQGAFTDGGNSSGYYNDHQDRYEFQNYTSWVHGKHMFKFGGRLRATREASSVNSNFNGTYTFSSLQSYAITQYGIDHAGPNGPDWAAIQAMCTPPPGSSITPQPDQCGGASQYSQTFGTPAVVSTYFDTGLYFQDEYKLKPNFTLSYGLRWETQNAIHDHSDWAPRLGIAWGFGKSGKTVLRAGYGMFYDRVGIGSILNTDRLNGVLQQQYIVQSPQFFDSTAPICDAQGNCSVPGGTTAHGTTYEFASHLRAPYTMQAAASLERQLWKNATGALTYINTRGVHQMVQINANAPYFDDYNPALGNIYQYFSQGIFKQNQLMANINWRAGSRYTIFGNYTYSQAHGDVNSGGFVTDSADISADYGRSSFDVRHRMMFGGSMGLPWLFRFSPFVIWNSGGPYNVVLGQDFNLDSIYNDRPAFAGAVNSGNLKMTPFGLLDLTPLPSETLVPINYGQAPEQFTFNMRFGKTFGVGPKLEKKAANDANAGGGQGGPPGGHMHGPGGNPFGAGGGGRGGGGDVSDRRYNLTFNVLVRNLFNNVNRAAPVGNVNSPFFGQSTALAGGPFGSGAYNRRIDFQVQFAF